MKKLLTLCLIVFFQISGYAQDNLIRVSDDVELIQVSAQRICACFLYIYAILWPDRIQWPAFCKW